MILNVSSLPSKGRNYKQETIEIFPLTYKRVIQYSKHPAKTKLEQLQRDILYLISDIKGFEKFNLYDLKSLIFGRKVMSITTNTNLNVGVKCGLCNKSFTADIDTNDIAFLPYPEEFDNYKSITLGGVEFNIKTDVTIEDFVNVLYAYMKVDKNIDEKIVYISTILQYMETPSILKKKIDEAVLDEIFLLETVYEYISGATSAYSLICQKCGGDMKIDINDLIVDFFRTLFRNQKINQEKITFK